ncbi:Uncharacterized protein TCM_004281 [Theobroma cacao]|uniref:Uncharacterized protein n=1 Tax=Theobroma cacao TaxID=3641 RepID=A0A061DQL0_THECC|nr:Uncharacterized protein TCM_004281 [Theobroma cacao]
MIMHNNPSFRDVLLSLDGEGLGSKTNDQQENNFLDDDDVDWLNGLDVSNSDHIQMSSIKEEEDEDSPYGPWMLVTRRKQCGTNARGKAREMINDNGSTSSSSRDAEYFVKEGNNRDVWYDGLKGQKMVPQRKDNDLRAIATRLPDALAKEISLCDHDATSGMKAKAFINVQLFQNQLNDVQVDKLAITPITLDTTKHFMVVIVDKTYLVNNVDSKDYYHVRDLVSAKMNVESVVCSGLSIVRYVHDVFQGGRIGDELRRFLIVLIPKAFISQMEIIRGVLDDFYACSSKKVSVSKSIFYCSNNVTTRNSHRARDNRRDVSIDIHYPECQPKPRKALISASHFPCGGILVIYPKNLKII